MLFWGSLSLFRAGLCICLPRKSVLQVMNKWGIGADVSPLLKPFIQGSCYAYINWKNSSKFLCTYVPTYILYVLCMCMYIHKKGKTFLCTLRYLGNHFWRLYKWRAFNIEGSCKWQMKGGFWEVSEYVELVLYKNGKVCLILSFSLSQRWC